MPAFRSCVSSVLAAVLLAGRVLVAAAGSVESPARVEIVDDWTIRVTLPTAQGPLCATFVIDHPDTMVVSGEKHERLPEFNAAAAPWGKGAVLAGVRAAECTVTGSLDPQSVVVRTGPSDDSKTLQQGKDWEADLEWGTIGRVAGGGIAVEQPVWIDYRHTPRRIDSVVLGEDCSLRLLRGAPHIVLCEPPAIAPGSSRLANISISGPIAALSPNCLFPILETSYPEPDPDLPPQALARLPETLRRLRSGEKLRILAWGDSVTTYGRWQQMFVDGLKDRFQDADIELITEAWGGRNTGSYLAEPPGSLHNFSEQVLGQQPHLVVSEFVNDAGLSPAEVASRYGQLLDDFRGIGAEWIILTPHYVMPAWMGPGFVAKEQREIDDDPRPYVAGLRDFTANHPEHVALADAALRYGRLWRQGIPYLTLMENNINHPNVAGHRIFSDALLALFGAPAAR
ncbi:MAG: SGNH/GDSL hydrolase family protein [Planctomycetota bacterium]|nr:MAG: SGNH/GDSL hydrolase family protein [Planctomycetota bacterium]